MAKDWKKVAADQKLVIAELKTMVREHEAWDKRQQKEIASLRDKLKQADLRIDNINENINNYAKSVNYNYAKSVDVLLTSIIGDLWDVQDLLKVRRPPGMKD